MQTLAVTFYDVVVWLHVSSVVLAFGPTFAFGIYIAVAQRKYPRAIPAVLEAQITISRSMITLGGVVILLTGLYLAWRAAGSSATSSSIWGLIAIIVLLGLVHGFFIPNDTRALRAAKRDIEAAGPTRRGRARRGVQPELRPQRPHGPGRRPDRDPDDLRDGREALPVGLRTA